MEIMAIAFQHAAEMAANAWTTHGQTGASWLVGGLRELAGGLLGWTDRARWAEPSDKSKPTDESEPGID
jgi:hypothetical protein